MNSRWFRFGLLPFFGILMLSGLLAGFFTRSIENALTLPAGHQNKVQPVIPPAASATPKVKSSPVATAQASPTPTNIIAQDNFQRANQAFWGTASDGQPWDGDANKINVFSITADTGQVANGQGFYNAILGPGETDAEILFYGSISSFKGMNLGAVLRWVDTNNWYKAFIDGNQLIILKKINGAVTRLGAVAFSAQAGTFYALRFRIVGTTLSASVWRIDSAEPNAWMITGTDTDLSSGFGGLRVLLQKGGAVTVLSFLEISIKATV